jgi:hypothetical protein
MIKKGESMKSLAQHVISMARGILVLDENLLSLKQALEEYNIRIIPVISGKSDQYIKEHSLPGRIFITNNAKDFKEDARSFEYGIISTENIKFKDPKSLAEKIHNEIIKNKLWSKTKGFILTLKDGERSTFRELK